MNKKLISFIIFVLFFINILNNVYSTNITWYYTYLDYRIPITITERSGQNLTDYQIPITINTASLISQGKMKPDCGDIRFTYLNTSDNKEYPISYWIESGCNTPNTIIWIKVPYIPANGNATIYMYYGNPNANNIGNKDNVFFLYDFYPNYPGWSDNRISLCGYQGMMGGYNIFGSSASTQKTINLPPGTYNLSFIFVKGDSWNGECGQLYLNGNLVWSKCYDSPTGTQICGDLSVDWNELFDFNSVIFNHSGGSLTIRFTSDLDQYANNEWWGVDKIMIRKYTNPEPSVIIGDE